MKQLNLLKILVYCEKELVKQFKMKEKGAKATSQGRGVNRAEEVIARAGYGNKMAF